MQFVTEQEQELRRVHTLIRKQMKAKLIANSDNSDLKPYRSPFAEGQAVYLRNEKRVKGQNPKLQFPYEGPYVIVKKYSDLNFKLQLNKRGLTKTVHHEKLKPCKTELPLWVKKRQEELQQTNRN